MDIQIDEVLSGNSMTAARTTTSLRRKENKRHDTQIGPPPRPFVKWVGGKRQLLDILQCAYDKGYQDGLVRQEKVDLDLDCLPESQAGTVRHKSPHAAYAQGYLDGVSESYK